jgi:hypothetical protein
VNYDGNKSAQNHEKNHDNVDKHKIALAFCSDVGTFRIDEAEKPNE